MPDTGKEMVVKFSSALIAANRIPAERPAVAGSFRHQGPYLYLTLTVPSPSLNTGPADCYQVINAETESRARITRKESALLDLGGWGTAGVFAAMVCSLVVIALVVTGLVLLIRPVFHSGDSSAADHAQGNGAVQSVGVADEASGGLSSGPKTGETQRKKGG